MSPLNKARCFLIISCSFGSFPIQVSQMKTFQNDPAYLCNAFGVNESYAFLLCILGYRIWAMDIHGHYAYANIWHTNATNNKNIVNGIPFMISIKKLQNFSTFYATLLTKRAFHPVQKFLEIIGPYRQALSHATSFSYSGTGNLNHPSTCKHHHMAELNLKPNSRKDTKVQSINL